jgi:hypothetical protein
MMLNGMAIENLMKGILIGRNTSLVTQQSMSPKVFPEAAMAFRNALAKFAH